MCSCLLDTESHILEDVNKCCHSLQEKDADTLDRTAGAIRGRCARVCNVVSAEMDNYEAGPYTDRVMEAVHMLRDQGNNLATRDNSVQYAAVFDRIKKCRLSM